MWTWLKFIYHRFQHLINWNHGRVVFFEFDGDTYVVFMCHGCGQLQGKQRLGAYERSLIDA